MKKLLLGLLGGLSLGMLFAPKKGKDLRNDLAASDNKLKTFSDGLSDMAKDVSNEVQAYLKTEEAKELIEKGKKGMEEVVNKAKDLSEVAKKELGKMAESASKKGNDLMNESKKVVKKATDAAKKLKS